MAKHRLNAVEAKEVSDVMNGITDPSRDEVYSRIIETCRNCKYEVTVVLPEVDIDRLAAELEHERFKVQKTGNRLTINWG